eukprot:COSAG06_NODE_35978_length_453_cov_0.824859_1_plen_53_part_10
MIVQFSCYPSESANADEYDRQGRTTKKGRIPSNLAKIPIFALLAFSKRDSTRR